MSGGAAAVPVAADECLAQTGNSAGQVSGATGRWVLAATILGSAMASIDGTAVNVALPTMQRSLHATAGDIQWVIESYSLFLSSLILVGGTFGDKFGRRYVFGLGTAIFTAGSIGCGLAPNVGLVIVARCVQGIGGAFLVPASLAIISASFDPEHRGRAIGTWAGFSSITTAAGPALGGWLTQYASWRAVFFINVPIAAVVMMLIVRHVPESSDSEAGRIDRAGAVVITAALAALVFGLIEAESRSLSNPVVILALVAAAVLMAAFIVIERTVKTPMVPLGTFRVPAFGGSNLLTVLLYGALGGSLFLLPFDLQQVQGYTPTEAGLAFVPFPLIVFSLSRWAGGLIQRFGPRPPLTIGPIVTAGGFALFALPGIHAQYWTSFFPAVILVSLGMSIVIAPLTTTVMSALPTREAGLASGVNNAVSRAAGLIMIAVFGLVTASIFTSTLDGKIGSLHLKPAVAAEVKAQRAKFVAITLPTGLAPSTQNHIRTALKESFVAGFRVSTLIAGLLAALSALAAVFFLRPDQDVPSRRAKQSD